MQRTDMQGRAAVAVLGIDVSPVGKQMFEVSDSTKATCLHKKREPAKIR